MRKLVHRKRSIQAIGILAGLVFAALSAAAQSVPAPPKPDAGPSLEVTMKYIEDKLNGVNFTTIQKSNTGDSHSWRLKITSAQGVPQGCMLS